MTNDDLVRDFIRVERIGNSMRLSVCMIHWKGAHRPTTRWKRVATVPAAPAEDRLRQAIAAIVDDARYFDVCFECNERKPVGWMLRRGLCQRCAERNHGVVF